MSVLTVIMACQLWSLADLKNQIVSIMYKYYYMIS